MKECTAAGVDIHVVCGKGCSSWAMCSSFSITSSQYLSRYMKQKKPSNKIAVSWQLLNMRTQCLFQLTYCWGLDREISSIGASQMAQADSVCKCMLLANCRYSFGLVTKGPIAKLPFLCVLRVRRSIARIYYLRWRSEEVSRRSAANLWWTRQRVYNLLQYTVLPWFMFNWKLKCHHYVSVFLQCEVARRQQKLASYTALPIPRFLSLAVWKIGGNPGPSYHVSDIMH